MVVKVKMNLNQRANDEAPANEKIDIENDVKQNNNNNNSNCVHFWQASKLKVSSGLTNKNKSLIYA